MFQCRVVGIYCFCFEMILIANFCIHASKGPVIIMNQLKYIYNSPFKDSHSHPIHTCFLKIASNEFKHWNAVSMN